MASDVTCRDTDPPFRAMTSQEWSLTFPCPSVGPDAKSCTSTGVSMLKPPPVTFFPVGHCTTTCTVAPAARTSRCITIWYPEILPGAPGGPAGPTGPTGPRHPDITASESSAMKLNPRLIPLLIVSSRPSSIKCSTRASCKPPTCNEQPNQVLDHRVV